MLCCYSKGNIVLTLAKLWDCGPCEIFKASSYWRDVREQSETRSAEVDHICPHWKLALRVSVRVVDGRRVGTVTWCQSRGQYKRSERGGLSHRPTGD